MEAIESKIAKVTVYREGARITRVAAFSPQINAAASEIRISGLPLALDDSSVRVSMRALNEKRPSPVACGLQIALEVPDSDPTLAPADDSELEAAKQLEWDLHEKIAQRQREVSRLERLKVFARPTPEDGSGPPPTPLAMRLKLVEFRGAHSDKLESEIRDLKEQLRRAGDRRAEIEDRVRRSTAAKKPREHELRKTVVVALDRSHGNGDAELDIEYVVPGARWAPAYSVRVDAADGTAEVQMRALVTQGTGEDWSKVKLTLSTAASQSFVDLPELTSLRIGRRQAEPSSIGWRPPPLGTAELYQAYDNSFAPDFDGSDTTAGATRDYLDMAGEIESFGTEVKEITYDTNVHVHRTAYPSAPPAQLMPPAGKLSKRSRRAATSDDEIDDLDAPTSEIDLDDARELVARSALPSPGTMLMASMAPALSDEAAFGYGSGGGVAPPEPPGSETLREVRAAESMLDYAELHMPSSRAARRGRLVPRERSERYLSLLAQRGLSVDIDAGQAVDDATFAARSVALQTAPVRYQWAWSEHFDYAYQTDHPATIPADGGFHSIPVASREGRSSLKHVIVPRESTDAFRVASIHNPFEAPLLPGPADIYLGRDFLLTSDLQLTAAKGPLELGLGVDQGIKVARNTRYGEDSAGLLGGSRSLRHEIHIEVENHTGRPVSAEVRERIPTPWAEEDEIKVEIGRVVPEWKEFDAFPDRPAAEKLRGAYQWNVAIAAGEKAEMRVHYEVKISAKHELVGGNRRER